MKQDITQKGGGFFSWNEGNGGLYESTKMSCAKRLEMGRPGGTENEARAGRNYYDECAREQAEEEEKKKIRQQQKDAARAAAQAKRDATKAAAEQAIKDRKQKQDAERAAAEQAAQQKQEDDLAIKIEENTIKFSEKTFKPNYEGNKITGFDVTINGKTYIYSVPNEDPSNETRASLIIVFKTEDGDIKYGDSKLDTLYNELESKDNYNTELYGKARKLMYPPSIMSRMKFWNGGKKSKKTKPKKSKKSKKVKKATRKAKK